MTLATSEAECIAALRATAGKVAQAAQKLGITRQSLHIRIERSPAIRAAIKEMDETLLDAAEGNVAKAIVSDGDVMTSRWYLQQKGKERGYGVLTIKLDRGSLTGTLDDIGDDIGALEALRDGLLAAADGAGGQAMGGGRDRSEVDGGEGAGGATGVGRGDLEPEPEAV